MLRINIYFKYHTLIFILKSNGSLQQGVSSYLGQWILDNLLGYCFVHMEKVRVLSGIFFP